MRVSVIGLGKLGLPLAAVLASSGFAVTGMDRDPDLVADLKTGRARIAEPGLQDLLDSLSLPIVATDDLDAAVRDSDATFIIVPTPSGMDGAFSGTAVMEAIRAVGLSLRRKPGFHLVVVCSTVMPGMMEQAGAMLQEAAGRLLGDDLGLCYCPQFIALGSVIADLRKPDLVLIGEATRSAGDSLEAICRKVCINSPQIRRTNFVNAELTKLALNTFVTTKISYANMISEICDRLAGADAAVVTAAVGCDSRVGGKYLFPAMGYGGPCFPRDNAALGALARGLGLSADLADATDRINRRQVKRIIAIIEAKLASGTVGILGLAYKPGTPVCEESQGCAIAERLHARGYRVLAYDPMALTAARASLGDRFEAATDVPSCVRGCNLLIIATPWPEFADLAATAFEGSPCATVLDCWRSIAPSAVPAGIELLYPGRFR